MRTYQFIYVLTGIGGTEDEALADALEAFDQDHGEPSETILIEENDE